VVGQGLDDTERLGRLARQTRLKLGISASELSERIGVSSSYIRAIERGDRAPAPVVAEELFNELEFQVSRPSGDRKVHGDLILRRGSETYSVEFKHRLQSTSESLAGATEVASRLQDLQRAMQQQLTELEELRQARTALDRQRRNLDERQLLLEDELPLQSGQGRRRREALRIDAAIGRTVRHLSTLEPELLLVVARLVEAVVRDTEAEPRQRLTEAVRLALEDMES